MESGKESHLTVSIEFTDSNDLGECTVESSNTSPALAASALMAVMIHIVKMSAESWVLKHTPLRGDLAVKLIDSMVKMEVAKMTERAFKSPAVAIPDTIGNLADLLGE